MSETENKKRKLTEDDLILNLNSLSQIKPKNLKDLLHKLQMWGHEVFPRLNQQEFIDQMEKICTKRRLSYYRYGSYTFNRESNPTDHSYGANDMDNEIDNQNNVEPMEELGDFPTQMDIEIPGVQDNSDAINSIHNDNEDYGIDVEIPEFDLENAEKEIAKQNVVQSKKEKALEIMRQKKRERELKAMINESNLFN